MHREKELWYNKWGAYISGLKMGVFWESIAVKSKIQSAPLQIKREKKKSKNAMLGHQSSHHP